MTEEKKDARFAGRPLCRRPHTDALSVGARGGTAADAMTLYRGDGRATATPCDAAVMIDLPLVELVLASVLAASNRLAFLVCCVMRKTGRESRVTNGPQPTFSWANRDIVLAQ
jgi:hypothetical protein